MWKVKGIWFQEFKWSACRKLYNNSKSIKSMDFFNDNTKQYFEPVLLSVQAVSFTYCKTELDLAGSDLHSWRKMVETNFLTVWSYCNLSEPATEGWNICTKMFERSRSKFITLKLTNYEIVVYLCTKLHSVTSQKTVFCVPAPVRTPNVIKSVVICSTSLHHLLDIISATWFA